MLIELFGKYVEYRSCATTLGMIKRDVQSCGTPDRVLSKFRACYSFYFKNVVQKNYSPAFALLFVPILPLTNSSIVDMNGDKTRKRV